MTFPGEGYDMIDEKDKLIHSLEAEVLRLRDENKKLEDTVQWMHDLIWQMVKEREKGGDVADMLPPLSALENVK